jgi:hypothetical protein
MVGFLFLFEDGGNIDGALDDMMFNTATGRTRARYESILDNYYGGMVFILFASCLFVGQRNAKYC